MKKSKSLHNQGMKIKTFSPWRYQIEGTEWYAGGECIEYK